MHTLFIYSTCYISSQVFFYFVLLNVFIYLFFFSSANVVILKDTDEIAAVRLVLIIIYQRT